MRITDIIYLGWTNLRSHFGRSLLTMGVIGTLFCLIFIAQFGFQGLENQYFAHAGANVNGAVIISANPFLIDKNHYFDINGNYIGETISLAEIAQDITANGGVILDTVNTDSGLILPKSLLSDTIETDVPTSSIPILINPQTALRSIERECPRHAASLTSTIKLYQDVQNQTINKPIIKNGNTYYPVGFATGSLCNYDLSFQSIDRNNYSIFNSLLGLFPAPDNTTIIINQSSNPPEQEGEKTKLIALFPDTQTAYRYLFKGHGFFSNLELPGHEATYGVDILAGISPETIFVFHMIHFFLNIGCVVLSIVAAIIIIFTSIRLIDQNKANIELYHSFGATKGQVQLLYLAYLLELVIGAAILSLILASLITILYSVFNQTVLSTLFMVSFGLSEPPSIMLWGANLEIIAFTILLLFLAPLSILINRKRF